MANNASPSYEQIFYLGGTGISGIRNISAGYSVGQKQIRALGAGFVKEVIAEPLRGELSMTRDLLYQDPVLGLTGEAPISGTLLYGVELDGNEKVYGFNTGYLTNFTINCETWLLPEPDIAEMNKFTFENSDLKYAYLPDINKLIIKQN